MFQGFVRDPTDGTQTPQLEGSKTAAALDILRRIKAFLAEKWAAEVVVGIGGSRDPGFEVGFNGWRGLADIYKSAVAIYCIASLLEDHSSDGRLDPGQFEIMTQLREACCRALISGLREARQCPQLRKLVLWPLIVAGIETADEDDAVKRFVGDELRWISKTLGAAAPLVGKDLLERRVWTRGLRRRRWDDLFDQPYVFVL